MTNYKVRIAIANDYVLQNCECVPLETHFNEVAGLCNNDVSRNELLAAFNRQFATRKEGIKTLQLALGLVTVTLFLIITRGLL